MDLKGKIVVITGGGSGIGGVASRLFAQKGATVVILELNEAAGKAKEQEILASGGNAWFIQTDVSSAAAVKAAFAQIQQRYGYIDALYNNASVFLGGRDSSIETVPEEIWRKVLSVNLDSVYFCSQNAIPLLKVHGGSIINTASSAAMVGVPGCAAYTATKGATVALTQEMAVDLGKYNIRVNCIAPAAIQTDMIRQSNDGLDNDFFLNQITPLKRWGRPEDVAELACFLVSDAAAYLNGTVIRADGGITVNGTVDKIEY